MTDFSSRPLRILFLLTDAFGAVGGIQKFNRDLASAVSNSTLCRELVVVPRLMDFEPGSLPPRINLVTSGLGGKRQYIGTVCRLLLTKRFDLVLCGHLNLLPLAWLFSRRYGRIPLATIIHGVDAWHPTRNRLTNLIASRNTGTIIAVSQITRDRFSRWAGTPEERCFILPNSIDLRMFGPGIRPLRLLDRYRLHGRTVLMTMGRLESRSRAKGFDEVLEVLPDLARDNPLISYLVCGSGPDQERLARKARDLGISDRVVFTGMVAEEEKAEHYRLADLYVMPSRGEGFGIVFLEAMACGIPVIASRKDGSREAVRGGLLGRLVDPDNREELKSAIRAALVEPLRVVPEGLSYFSFANFGKRVQDMLDVILSKRQDSESR